MVQPITGTPTTSQGLPPPATPTSELRARVMAAATTNNPIRKRSNVWSIKISVTKLKHWPRSVAQILSRVCGYLALALKAAQLWAKLCKQS